MSVKHQILGLVRFSFPTKNAFRVKYENDQAQFDALFAPERMEFRFSMLEKLCAHSMKHQTDTDFRLIFLIGESMPEEYVDRLENSISDIPGAVIISMKKDFLYRSTKAAFEKLVNSDSEYVTAFRLDDDDAVAIDYISRIRARSEMMISAGLASTPTVLAYTNGLYWDARNETQPFMQIKERTALGLAASMITSADMPTNVYQHNHRQYGAILPTFLDPGPIMFIRSLHGYNDSGKKNHLIPSEETDTNFSQILQQRFGLNADEFMPKSG